MVSLLYVLSCCSCESFDGHTKKVSVIPLYIERGISTSCLRFMKRTGCWNAELFEMMRKEQHRQLHEQKQPLVKVDNPSVLRKHDESFLWDDHPHHSPPESPVQRITTSIPVPTTTRPAFPPGFSKVNQLKQNISQEFQLQVGLQCYA